MDVSKVTFNLKVLVLFVGPIWWTAWNMSAIDTNVVNLSEKICVESEARKELDKAFVATVQDITTKGNAIIRDVLTNKKDIEHIEKMLVLKKEKHDNDS